MRKGERHMALTLLSVVRALSKGVQMGGTKRAKESREKTKAGAVERVEGV